MNIAEAMEDIRKQMKDIKVDWDNSVNDGRHIEAALYEGEIAGLEYALELLNQIHLA